jgi:hypothetical protein
VNNLPPTPPFPGDPAPEEPELTIVFQATAEGRVHSRTFAPPARGEDNVDEVANLVVILLNEGGESWGPVGRPLDPNTEVDAMARGPHGFLYLQIVRVPVDESFWNGLATTGTGQTESTVAELADHIIQGIRKKARRYSPEVKGRLFLVLDATKGSLYDSPSVIAAYAKAHLTEARSAGFDDVFLLGHSRFVNLLRSPDG